jgi:hypothetical protein
MSDLASHDRQESYRLPWCACDGCSVRSVCGRLMVRLRWGLPGWGWAGDMVSQVMQISTAYSRDSNVLASAARSLGKIAKLPEVTRRLLWGKHALHLELMAVSL